MHSVLSSSFPLPRWLTSRETFRAFPNIFRDCIKLKYFTQLTLTPRVSSCLPLVTPTSRPQLRNALATFRDKVTGISTPELPNGIPEKAIRPLDTLHLTLGVMSLLSQERIDSSLKLLRELNLGDLLSSPGLASPKDSNQASNSASQSTLKDKVIERDSKETEPLRVSLKGLESMHTPSKTSILYSSPIADDRLYPFCQKLKDMFTEAEFLVEESRPLKLHATIINTVYVPGVRGKGGHGKNKAKLTFDAREVLEDFEDFEWMSNVRVEKLVICKMGARKNDNGEDEYIIEGEAEMP
jgi:activating signal cointegrator complex subunit 1